MQNITASSSHFDTGPFTQCAFYKGPPRPWNEWRLTVLRIQRDDSSWLKRTIHKDSITLNFARSKWRSYLDIVEGDTFVLRLAFCTILLTCTVGENIVFFLKIFLSKKYQQEIPPNMCHMSIWRTLIELALSRSHTVLIRVNYNFNVSYKYASILQGTSYYYSLQLTQI